MIKTIDDEFNIPDKAEITYNYSICKDYCKKYFVCRNKDVKDCKIKNKNHLITYNGAIYGTLIITSEWDFCSDYCKYSYHCRHNLVTKCRITQTQHVVTVMEDCFRNDGGITPPIAPIS